MPLYIIQITVEPVLKGSMSSTSFPFGASAGSRESDVLLAKTKQACYRQCIMYVPLASN